MRGVRKFIDDTLEEARREQKVRTLFGRVRPIPDINSKNANLRGFAERTAVNTPLQGTAADLIKTGHDPHRCRLAGAGPEIKHDACRSTTNWYSKYRKRKWIMKTLVREEMENVHALSVPLLVEIGVGSNWRDLE